MLQRMIELKAENERLRAELAEMKLDLAHVNIQRDEAIQTAIELAHIATYAAEQGHRHGMEIVRNVRPTEV